MKHLDRPNICAIVQSAPQSRSSARIPLKGCVVSKGYFVWNDLMTSDPAAVLPFYQGLLGWTTETSDMGTGPYTMFKVGDKHVGGVTRATRVGPTGSPTSRSTTSTPPASRSNDWAAGSWASRSTSRASERWPMPPIPTAQSSPRSRRTRIPTTSPSFRMASSQAARLRGTRSRHPTRRPDDSTRRLRLGPDRLADGRGQRVPRSARRRDAGRRRFQGPGWRPGSLERFIFEAPGTIQQAVDDVRRLGGQVLQDIFTVEGTGDITVVADPAGAVFGIMKSIPMGDS